MDAEIRQGTRGDDRPRRGCVDGFKGDARGGGWMDGIPLDGHQRPPLAVHDGCSSAPDFPAAHIPSLVWKTEASANRHAGCQETRRGGLSSEMCPTGCRSLIHR